MIGIPGVYLHKWDTHTLLLHSLQFESYGLNHEYHKNSKAYVHTAV